MYSSTLSENLESLDDVVRNSLLKLARDTITAAFTHDTHAPLEAMERNESHLPSILIEPHPCFVSLFGPRERLRGCIGRLQSDEKLYEGVFHMTREAAFHDPRFRPVQKEEIDRLTIHISVLGPPEPLTDFSKITIGRHGLSVTHDGRRGVLLADVAKRMNWTREEFLSQTCLKADLSPENFRAYQWSAFTEIHFSEEP